MVPLVQVGVIFGVILSSINFGECAEVYKWKSDQTEANALRNLKNAGQAIDYYMGKHDVAGHLRKTNKLMFSAFDTSTVPTSTGIATGTGTVTGTSTATGIGIGSGEDDNVSLQSTRSSIKTTPLVFSASPTKTRRRRRPYGNKRRKPQSHPPIQYYVRNYLRNNLYDEYSY